MADVLRHLDGDAQVAEQFVADRIALASRASALAGEILRGPAPANAGHLPIDIEISGVDERMTLIGPARPGAVRGAVEKTLRRLGLSTFDR